MKGLTKNLRILIPPTMTLFFLFIFFLPAYGKGLKIGFVDPQKVLDESLFGKEIQKSINEYVQSRQKIVDLEEKELKKLQEEITKQKDILSPEAKKKKEETFQRRFMEYQQKVNELQKEIEHRKAEKLNEFNEKLKEVVTRIGLEEGYTAIFNNPDMNLIIYAQPAANITDRVIAEMNKDFLKEEKKKK